MGKLNTIKYWEAKTGQRSYANNMELAYLDVNQ